MGARSLHCVRVMTDDRTQQLWVAATARDEAVDCVLDVIPEGWTARLLDEQFEPQADVASDMAPGEVRELCETKRWPEMH
jgi:hypothetical protein